MIVLRGKEDGIRGTRDLESGAVGEDVDGRVEEGRERVDLGFVGARAGSRIGMDESEESWIRPNTWPT